MSTSRHLLVTGLRRYQRKEQVEEYFSQFGHVEVVAPSLDYTEEQEFVLLVRDVATAREILRTSESDGLTFSGQLVHCYDLDDPPVLYSPSHAASNQLIMKITPTGLSPSELKATLQYFGWETFCIKSFSSDIKKPYFGSNASQTYQTFYLELKSQLAAEYLIRKQVVKISPPLHHHTLHIKIEPYSSKSTQIHPPPRPEFHSWQKDTKKSATSVISPFPFRPVSHHMNSRQPNPYQTSHGGLPSSKRQQSAFSKPSRKRAKQGSRKHDPKINDTPGAEGSNKYLRMDINAKAHWMKPTSSDYFSVIKRQSTFSNFTFRLVAPNGTKS